MNRLLIITLLLVLNTALALLWAGTARADTPIDVTTTADGINVNGCSLREAVQVVRENAANDYGCNVSPDPNAVYTINLDPGQTYSLTVFNFGFENDNQSGDLDIFGTATIQGGTGTIIDAGQIDRVLDVFSATTVITVANVIIEDGLPPNITNEGEHGGAIRNQEARLNILRSTLRDNAASTGEDGISDDLPNAAVGGHGGAIYSSGPLYLEEVTLLNNRSGNGGNGIGNTGSPGGDGGDGGDGGGIYALDSVMIISSTIRNNRTGQGGDGGDGSPNGIGGSGGLGGGLAVSDNLTIYNTIIDSNQAGVGGQAVNNPADDGLGGNGGGLWSFQSAQLDGVTIEANEAGDSVNGLGAAGGGIYARGVLTLTNSTLENNESGTSSSDKSGDGGGLFLSGASRLYISGTTVASNSIGAAGIGFLPGNGGGLAINGSPARIANSSFQFNRGAQQGGGLYSNSSTSGDNIDVVNTTFYQNTAEEGGALYTEQPIIAVTISLTHTTIASNTANSGDGGGVYADGGNLRLVNNIFDGNTAGISGPDCFSDGATTPNAAGQNLFGSAATDCSNSDDTTNTAAKLGSLTDGYLPLQSGSPALDVLSPGTAGCGTTPPTDQRGVSRPQFSGCDLGAFEADPGSPAFHSIYIPLILKAGS